MAIVTTLGTLLALSLSVAITEVIIHLHSAPLYPYQKPFDRVLDWLEEHCTVILTWVRGLL